MKQAIDIHNYRRLLQKALDKLREAPISRKNKQLIRGFQEHCSTKGLGLPRQERYVRVLSRMAAQFGKDFDRVTKTDIVKLVKGIQEGAYSPYTRSMYKAMLKTFYKWLKGCELGFPEEVSWINTTVKRSDRKLPANGDLLTEDDVNKLVEAAEHPRDKALISVLYESGARIGEIGSMQVSNVKVDKYGAVIHVQGKTGARPVRVIASTPHLMTWLQCHPMKDNPEAPLWVNIGTTNHNQPMAYRNMKDLLTRLFKKAGIKKKCNPHMFRHSRATYLADHLTEFQMNQYFGWVQGSGMPATYVHMNGSKIDASILELNGVKRSVEDKESSLKPIICPKCDTINAHGAKFCCKCAGILDAETACELEQKDVAEERSRLEADRVMDLLISDPEFVKMFVEKVKGLSTRTL